MLTPLSVTPPPTQERLKELSLDPEQFLASLPAPVAARVEELKKLQGKHDDLEEQYKKERAALEAKYQTLYGEHP
jgi:nucleosome assembly protein 1-like 1